MAEPNIPAMKPDKKLLKKVEAANAAILSKVTFREEAEVFEERKATSSDKRVGEWKEFWEAGE